MSVDVSIVIPTRNRAQLVHRLLTQLAAIDDGLTREVIVVDESSTDRTSDVLDYHARNHGVIAIRNDPPRGSAGARNVGLARATGDYLTWIDDDDLCAPDRLRRQFDVLTSSAPRWSCAARVNIDDSLQIIGHYPCPSPDGPLLPRLVTFNCIPAAAQGLLVERALAEEIGGYDESLVSAEDWDFCIRLCERSEPHLLDEPLVGYRAGYTSKSSKGSRVEDSLRAIIDKHEPLANQLGVRADWARIYESRLFVELSSSRWRAASRALRCFTLGPTPQRALRVPVILVAPHWFEARSVRRQNEQVPARWRTQAGAWLAEIDPTPALPAPSSL